MAIRRARNVADYTKMDDANILTMKHYFKDPEWFDKKGVHAEKISDGQRQGSMTHKLFSGITAPIQKYQQMFSCI